MYESLLKILNRIGLTDYEAKAYTTLNSRIIAKAEDISLESGVPRSKIYSVLSNLEKKNLLTITQGRPLKYTVVEPNQVFKMYRKSISTDLEEAELRLTSLYESQLSNTNAPIWTLEDSKKIVDKELEIIKRAQDYLYLRIGFLYLDELKSLLTQLKKAKNRGVTIKIISSSQCKIDNTIINISTKLKNNDLLIKEKALPTAKLIIRDDKEMLLVFADMDKTGNVDVDSSIGLWNHYSTIINHYTNAFNMNWNQKK
ncbi:MAG: helix-turn-helix domain-containing protein [Methanobacteriaceae archaeon]|nr:helix-turn-helix domain-containing protein [Methanobacteriaceae archaeon]